MIKSLTDKFLTCPRMVLCILFVMASFNWYDSSDSTTSHITTAVNLIGGISYICWVYAIGHRANDKLQEHNIKIGIFKFFNLGFFTIIGSVLTMFFLSQGSITRGDSGSNLSYHITYSKPAWVGLLFLAGLIFTVLVASKVLVSAEQNKEAKLGDYFKTLLLFTFSWLGLWWIQPRVEKL